ncbi:MAG: hypothetical protein Kow0099_21500 [Candidatus Abyssubacteria bacterium]
MSGVPDPKSEPRFRHEKSLRSRFLSLSGFLLLLLSYLLLSPFNVADNVGPWLDSDYGILTNNGLELFKGRFLYKEIWSLYTPAATYAVALLFRLFGDSLLTLRIALAFVGTISSILVFFIARTLTSRTYAAAVTAFTILLGPVSVNFPYPNWFCIPLGLGMVALAHLGWSRRSAAYYLVAGAAAGAIFSFKINWGAFALAALLCIEFFESALDERDSRVIGGKWMSVLFWPGLALIPAASLAAIRDQISLSRVILFSLPALAVSVVGGILFTTRFTRHMVSTVLQPLAMSISGFCITVIPWIVYFTVQLGWSGLYGSLIHPLTVFSGKIRFGVPPVTVESGLLMFVATFQGALFLNKKSLVSRRVFLLALWVCEALLLYKMSVATGRAVLSSENILSNKEGFRLICYVPVAVHVGIACMLIADILNLDSGDRKHVHLVMALWIYSVAAFHTFFPVTDTLHFIWNMVPVVLLGGVLVYRSVALWRDEIAACSSVWKSTLRSMSVLPLPLLLLLFFGLPIFNLFVRVQSAPFRVSFTRFADLDSPRAGVLMPEPKAADMNAVIEYINSHTAPDEHMLDVTGSLFYFLTDRPNPVPFGHFVQGFLSHQDMAEALRALETVKPRLAVVSYAADLHLTIHWPYFHRYLNSQYSVVKECGDYRLLVRNEARAAELGRPRGSTNTKDGTASP